MLVAANCHARWSTGYMISKSRQKFGFLEATMKAADIDGLNNAFWLVTEDHFEIDIAEVHYPNIARLTLHDNNKVNNPFPPAVGFGSKFTDNFSQAFHHFGVLWTPTDIIYEVDGEPIATISTNDSIKRAADIRFSTALMDYAGKIPSNPEGMGCS
jgi:beta-glucanase (GH16 family)